MNAKVRKGMPDRDLWLHPTVSESKLEYYALNRH